MSNALDVQVGGAHYKDKKIQPVEYIQANNLNFLEGCIVKRITRWRDKNGLEDLMKIKHEIDLLIEMERKYGQQLKEPDRGFDEAARAVAQCVPEPSAEDALTDSGHVVCGYGACRRSWGSERSVFQGTPEAGTSGPDFPSEGAW